jgi:hypothetical protein
MERVRNTVIRNLKKEEAISNRQEAMGEGR